jgi:heme exporter protein A
MADVVLGAKGIEKSYGRNRVLGGVTIDVREGDRYVLFGPNGAGKTTLLKVLSTIMRPDAGELRLFGAPPGGDLAPARARIGVLSHVPYLYDELTAWENLDFFARLYGVRGREDLVRAALKDMGLYHRAHDRVGTLSQGMRQRLGLARALLHNPDLVFLDEPYAGLDLAAQETLTDHIVRMSKAGRTVFAITHDMARGFAIATRVGALVGGRLALEADVGDRVDFEHDYLGLVMGGRA